MTNFIDFFLEHSHFGCTVSLATSESELNVSELITWYNVLMGRMDGLQVWSQRPMYRNLSTIFDNRRTKSQVLLQLVNLFYEELFGDRVQILALCNCYYRTMFNIARSILKKTEKTTNMIEKIEFVNEANLKLLLDTIESKFSDAINECFTTFSDISSPILSVSDIDELIELYKTQLPLHYRTMSRILGIDQKQNVTRNLHLVQSGY